MRVEIITAVVGRNSDRYSIVVKVDGVIKDTLTALPWNVSRVRNRECTKWSNIADEVTANEIPRIFTLDYETSWRNNNGRK